MAPTAPIHSVNIARRSRAAGLYNSYDDDDISYTSQVTFDFSTTSSMVSDRTWDHPLSSLTGLLAGGGPSSSSSPTDYGYGKYMPQQAPEKKTANPKRGGLAKKNKVCEVLDFTTSSTKQVSKKSLYEDDEDDRQETASAQEEEQSKSTVSSRSRSLYSDDESSSDEEEEESPRTVATPNQDSRPSPSGLEDALQQHRLRLRSLYNDEDEGQVKSDAGTVKTEDETDHSSCRATSPRTVESADEATDPVVVGREISRNSTSSRMSELSDIEEWSGEDDLSFPHSTQEVLPVVKARRSTLRSQGESLAEQRRLERAARLERAKERILREREQAEQEQAEETARKQAEEAKKAAQPMSQEERMRFAYQWYSRCGQPTRKQFQQKLPAHLGITSADIDQLPWTKDGERVDPKKGMALLVGRSS